MNVHLAMAMAMALSLAFAGAVRSQPSTSEFPTRAVRLIVPYAAGGAPDVIARLIGQKMSDAMGAPFIVDNRPGAGGVGASEAVARASPDGYTLLVPDVPQLAINPFIFRTLGYDPLRDFAPISIIATTPMFVLVRADSDITSMAALIERARSRPGQLTYGSAGIGSLHHIAMESIKTAAGIDLVHVPYKGTGQSVPAFMAGEVSILVSTLAAVEPFIRSHQARLLAGTPARRTSRLPDLPAVAETVPGIDFAGEIGLLAPAGTPTSVVNRLALQVQRAVQSDDVQQRLGGLGAIAVGSSPETYARSIKASLGVFEKAVKAARLSAE
jgi:tripartite-type tricarboxylate transporter receptor subunit TctC